jgi:hypothetical protein
MVEVFLVPVVRSPGRNRTGLPGPYEYVRFVLLGTGALVCHECGWIGHREDIRVHARTHERQQSFFWESDPLGRSTRPEAAGSNPG